MFAKLLARLPLPNEDIKGEITFSGRADVLALIASPRVLCEAILQIMRYNTPYTDAVTRQYVLQAIEYGVCTQLKRALPLLVHACRSHLVEVLHQ